MVWDYVAFVSTHPGSQCWVSRWKDIETWKHRSFPWSLSLSLSLSLPLSHTLSRTPSLSHSSSQWGKVWRRDSSVYTHTHTHTHTHRWKKNNNIEDMHGRAGHLCVALLHTYAQERRERGVGLGSAPLHLTDCIKLRPGYSDYWDGLQADSTNTNTHTHTHTHTHRQTPTRLDE